MGTLRTGTKLGNQFSRDLQVLSSFAQKKIVFLIFVKSERNGENKFEKNIRIDSAYPMYTCHVILNIRNCFHV